MHPSRLAIPIPSFHHRESKISIQSSLVSIISYPISQPSLSTISSHPISSHPIPSSLLFSSPESRLCSFPHQQHQTPTHPCAHTPTASTVPTATNTRALSTAPPANFSDEPPVAAVSHPYFPSSRIVLGGVACTQTTQPTGETPPRSATRWFWEIPTNHTHHGRRRMDEPRLNNESNGFISASKPTRTRCSFLDRVNGRFEASFLDRESATPWWTHEEPFHFDSLPTIALQFRNRIIQYIHLFFLYLLLAGDLVESFAASWLWSLKTSKEGNSGRTRHKK